ncbi:hypothetical protein AA23498_1061 [Acetobacter nitrogenifigens DSM 23921 = NBRC 105050]|uniref:Uncharacterized protein n=1 Tax=Acetobacter nitrogenifigens DSM 23921 = NBRC 105050 TaxID=1120919 RepID=A0A511XAN1_9PROT|nr:hypothetical protein [Acetobacter nitrogenifigens]GBQ91066.1 hypothetical protein AA23498_1061 [Acetobacter nitrogenifigens DSM 23921 = NBRC 105050]GEN60013.1 hypothetical protein ANI02nite_18970 [Acetobacter nitrogenifigens DSM 23921 = NBRC 105050]
MSDWTYLRASSSKRTGTRLRLTGSLLVAVGLCAGALALRTTPALAQETQSQAATPPAQPSAAEMAAMRRDVETAARYPLPKDFIPRMYATVQSLRANGLQPPPPDRLSLDATIARVSAVPGIQPVLSAHGFTPRDFVLGLTAFGMTVAIMSNQEAQASGQAPKLNPANVAMIRANPEGTQALMQEMNSQPQ